MRILNEESVLYKKKLRHNRFFFCRTDPTTTSQFSVSYPGVLRTLSSAVITRKKQLKSSISERSLISQRVCGVSVCARLLLLPSLSMLQSPEEREETGAESGWMREVRWGLESRCSLDCTLSY